MRARYVLTIFSLVPLVVDSGSKKAMDGTYVHYDSDIMLGILALEASRAGGVVVGEDLGVVPAYVSKSLSEHGILGCAVEWFEQFDGEFRAPKDWRPYALASVNTHDLLRQPATWSTGMSNCVNSLDCCPVRSKNSRSPRKPNITPC